MRFWGIKWDIILSNIYLSFLILLFVIYLKNDIFLVELIKWLHIKCMAKLDLLNHKLIKICIIEVIIQQGIHIIPFFTVIPF
jgi:hypothetical protein